MKKKVFMMLPCIAVVAIAAFVGKKEITTRKDVMSNLLLQNVEALAQDGNPEGEIHYSNMHIACYETHNYGGIYVTEPNGKYSASCWENVNSDKGYHHHSCSSCSSY